MAIIEKKIINQVVILPSQNAINVQWVNQVIKDDVLIAQTYHRCAYAEENKAAFLAEVEGAQSYLALVNWP